MKKLGYFLFLLILPFMANGQIYISEIMYDAEGTDSGREWVEVFNSGGESVDLTGWKLFENDTNHKINLFDEEGDFVIDSGEYIVIADNPTKFLEDWPGFSGVVFDSAFSLKNTGEEVILRDGEFGDIDSIFYDVELGAVGGLSLQKVDGEWLVAEATPGEQNSGEEIYLEEENNNNLNTITSIDSEYIQPEDRPNIKAFAGEDKIAIAGAMTNFEGIAYGLQDDLLENARYLWNLGDGSLKDGKNITHFYKYPGEYRVVLDVSSGGYSVSDVLIVKAIPNEIFISEIKTGVDSFIELRNPSSQEIDISGWRFLSGNPARDAMHNVAGGQKFTFSENSFIRPYSYLVISSYSSGIIFESGSGRVDLLYSSGLLADSFIYSGSLGEDQSFSRDGENIGIAEQTPGGKNKKLDQNIYQPVVSEVSTQSHTEVSTLESIYTEKETQAQDKSPSVEEDQGVEMQQANVITVGNNSGVNKKYYYFGVLVLVVFAGFGIYVVRRKS